MTILKILVVLLFLLALSIPSHSVVTFERWYGGTEDEFGNSVTQSSDGGYIIAGSTESFGAGSYDVYLIKTDSLGDTLWTKTYGGSQWEWAYSAAQTSDEGYIIVGHTSSFGAGCIDFYLIKIDSLGDTLWTKTYGGIDDDMGYSVAQTSDEGYIITGSTYSFGAGYTDAYLIKTDSLGDTLWTRVYGGAWHDYGFSIDITSDGGYIIAGSTASFGVGGDDVYLIKTDALGDTLWTKTIGGTSNEIARSISQTSDGGFIIIGITESFSAGAFDVYLIKTDSLGDTLWTKSYGGIDDDQGYSVVQTSDEGYILAGFTTSFGVNWPDVYLIRTDSLGDSLWTRFYGVSYDWDYGYSVSLTSDVGYIVAGRTSYMDSIQSDIYLIKTDSEGNVAVREEKQDHRTKTTEIRITCQPNPFTTSTTIILPGIGQSAKSIELQIFDVTGRRVREISLLPFDFSFDVTWDGRDAEGKAIPPGIYFLKLNGKPVEKVVKVR